MFVLVRQFVLYCTGGAIAAVTNLAITYALTEWLLIWYLVSYAIGTLVAIGVNFLYQRGVTFGVVDRVSSRLPKFVLVMGVTFLLNILMVYVLTDVLGIWYIFSVVMVTIVVSVVNFSLNRFWTFS